MSTTNLTVAFFNEQFAAAKRIEFKPEWRNGTGYLDNAVHEQTTETVSFIDNHSRRGILIPGEMDSSIVIFERYTDTTSPLIIQYLQIRTYPKSGKVVKGTNAKVFMMYLGDDEQEDDHVVIINRLMKDAVLKSWTQITA